MAARHDLFYQGMTSTYIRQILLNLIVARVERSETRDAEAG
jgi:hypothetical protein